ncbi:NAD(P)-dependent alcohol dehydrogenase [Demequina rhizosphaerae]|uniref:NAD(P)-dependent alcohol dehydrogenase n=1 Tax=Demequina rhizosphaerae TaxID=1638985 RepID=UPI0007817413|nr:NAD(P)-dependent alcohol dehydrogenase [Demequina rhizosphaerae]
MNTTAPATTRTVQLDRYGSPTELQHRTVDIPAPADDQVVVRVRAAGINRGDGLAIAGLPYAARLSYGVTRPKRPVPGTDVAGTVVAVGASVTAWRHGDDVVGWAVGAFAEHALASASSLLAKPEGLTFEEAAALPTAAVTALQALDKGGIGTARRVLVLGASGGVGSFAVQLAAAYGAEVTGVCSTRNVDLVRSLGARHVVDYTAEDVAALRGYDLVVDLAGQLPLTRARRLARRGGAYVVVGGGKARTLTGMRRFAAAGLLSPFGPQRLRPLFATPRREDLATVLSHVVDGRVHPSVEAAYALRDAADAVDFVHRGKARGKVVLVP